MPFFFDPVSTCDVCLDSFAVPGSGANHAKEPHAIQCGHVFCLECMMNIEGGCPHCRQPFRRDKIHRLHVDTSRDPSPPGDVYNALRLIDTAGQRVRRHEERGGEMGTDIEDMTSKLQAFVYIHADKSILDILHILASVLDKYADKAALALNSEHRLHRHLRSERETQRRFDTLQETYMDQIAILEAELERHSLPNPLPAPSQESLAIPGPSSASSRRRSFPPPPALGRSVSREERQKSIQHEADMRLEEAIDGPTGGDVIEENNALGLNRTPARSSLTLDTSRPASQRSHYAERPPESSTTPYHPAQSSSSNSAGISRRSSRHERNTASRNSRRASSIYHAPEDAVSDEDDDTHVPFIPPVPLDLSLNAPPTASASSRDPSRTPFIPAPPEITMNDGGSSNTLTSSSANGHTRQQSSSVRRPFIPPPPELALIYYPDNDNAQTHTHTSAPSQSNRVPFIPPPPPEVINNNSSQSARAPFIPPESQDVANAYPSTSNRVPYSGLHVRHSEGVQQIHPEDQRSRRSAASRPVIPPTPTTSSHASSFAQSNSNSQPLQVDHSGDLSRRHSSRGPHRSDDQNYTREHSAHPVILPTPAAGSSAANLPLLGHAAHSQQPNIYADSARLEARNRRRSTSGAVPPPFVPAPAPEASRPAPMRYPSQQQHTHTQAAAMPSATRRPTATPSTASSADSAWSTVPAVGAASQAQAVPTPYVHGRHPSIDTTNTAHAHRPPLGPPHYSSSGMMRRPSVDASAGMAPPVSAPPTGNPHPLAMYPNLPGYGMQPSTSASVTPYPYGGMHGHARSGSGSGGAPQGARSTPGSGVPTPAPTHTHSGYRSGAHTPASASASRVQMPPSASMQRLESNNNLLF